jgi:hypothetical protein
MSEVDMVSHPPHYTSSEAYLTCQYCDASSSIECIDVTSHMGFLEGNIIKYVWRHKLKGGIESLKKARWYLDYLIKQLEEK